MLLLDQMEDLNFIESVTERDIDLLILEELTVSFDFFEWFAGKICNKDVERVIGVWHSITDKRFGESDLASIFVTKDGIKFGLLIENKIDALPQPDQCNRYNERGKLGVENKTWQEYLVCLIAPKMYISKDREAGLYQNKISYEEIEEFLSSEGSKRSIFKAKLIKNAIEQNRRGYSIEPDERVTDFWKKYHAYASENYPELEMPFPGPKPSESDWPDFRPRILNKKTNLVHKLFKGVVDLQIPGLGDKIQELSKNLEGKLEDDIEIVKTGKSASLRISVPVIDRFDSFEEQFDDIKIGFAALSRLLKIGIEIKNLL